MGRPLKPRYRLSWLYRDGGKQGSTEVVAEEVDNLQDAVIKVKRRIAKQCSCFPAEIEITEAFLPIEPPPRRLPTRRIGSPPLFEGEVEKRCVRIQKPIAEALRKIGGGSLSKGLALVAQAYLDSKGNYEEFQ